MSTEPVELSRHLQLLWGIDDGGRRGPKPKLTVTDIGDAAVAVADADGLDAVSMKAIAQRLGLTTMSLYRYVESKEDVYELMLDMAYGHPDPDLTAEGSWRHRITAWAHAISDRLRARPWLTRIPMTRPPAGPRTLAWTEAGIRSYDDTPLTHQEKLSSLLVVDGFVRNFVRMASDLGELAPADQSRGTDQYSYVLGQVLDEATYPRLVAAVRSETLGDDDDFYTTELEFGLDIILDGIGARISAKTT